VKIESTGSRVVPGTGETVFAQQSVHERRLAGVGAADDGHGEFTRGVAAVLHLFVGRRILVGRRRRRQTALDLVEQFAHAASVLGADLHDGIEAQPVEFEGPGDRPLVVGLVDGQHDRLAGAAHRLGNLLVARHEPFPAVHHEDHEVGRGQGALTGFDDQLVQWVLAAAEHAPGVGKQEAAIGHWHRVTHGIPSGAGHGRHNRPPGSRHPVEQRGLADIGPADEYDCGQRAGHGRSSVRAIRRIFACRRPRGTRGVVVVDSVSDSIYDSYLAGRSRNHSMIKVDIVNEVSRLAEITKVKAELAVDAVFDAMRISMQRGERIELRGFGVFQVKPRKRGIGRNPRTGREVKIPPGRTIRFKPGKDLQNIG
jgi:DNA-binding protein HU-beta